MMGWYGHHVLPIILEYFLTPLLAYYSQNFAGIMYQSLTRGRREQGTAKVGEESRKTENKRTERTGSSKTGEEGRMRENKRTERTGSSKMGEEGRMRENKKMERTGNSESGRRE